jgi:sarcosine oxidase subunit beta
MIVVGSGIVGSSTAYYAAKKGMKVIVIDKDGVIGNGGSSRNGGGVRVSGRLAPEIPLAKYAVENIWPNLADELGVDIEYHRGGNIRFAFHEKDLPALENIKRTNEAYGVNIELIDRAEAKRRCPYVGDSVVGAAVCDIDGSANPLKATLAMYRAARNLGVAYYSGEEAVAVQNVRGKARRVITANGNVYEGEHIVLACSYQARALANTVGVDFPFRQKLIEIFVTEATKPMFDFMFSAVGASGGAYGHQTEHGSFVWGGDSGHEHHPIFEKDTFQCIQPTASAISRGTMTYFPALAELKVIRTWAGWIDLCEDLVPVIGPVEEVPGLMVAAGYSAHGFCLGPVSGKILAEVAVGETPCVDWKPLAYDRFKSIF